MVKRGYAITAGDVGHPFLIAALMKYGMSDVLNKMTNITDKPGYGYQVVNGATTLTEEWARTRTWKHSRFPESPDVGKY